MFYTRIVVPSVCIWYTCMLYCDSQGTQSQAISSDHHHNHAGSEDLSVAVLWAVGHLAVQHSVTRLAINGPFPYTDRSQLKLQLMSVLVSIKGVLCAKSCLELRARNKAHILITSSHQLREGTPEEYSHEQGPCIQSTMHRPLGPSSPPHAISLHSLCLKYGGVSQILALHPVFQHRFPEELFQGVFAVRGRGIRIIALCLLIPYQHALCRIVPPNSTKLC